MTTPRVVTRHDAEQVVSTHPSSTNLCRYSACRDTRDDTNTSRTIDLRKSRSRIGTAYTSVIHQPSSLHLKHGATWRHQHQRHHFTAKISTPNRYLLLNNDPPTFLGATKAETAVVATSARVIHAIFHAEQIPAHTLTPSTADIMYHPSSKQRKQGS